MNILAADDEELMLEALMDAIQKSVPEGVVHGFSRIASLLEFAQNTSCEIAFLDIQMRGMNGLEVAKKLKEINPKINIVFVTGFNQYAMDAICMHASGYITKPVTKEKIDIEMENLRHPIATQTKHRIRVQCFGNFEAFADDHVMQFRYNKTLELFAYLVDRRGAMISGGELMAILWEDKPDSASMRSQLRNLISDLRSTLKQVGAENVLIKVRRNYAIDISEIDCDYYDFLNNRGDAKELYSGEYMAQYSWAEMTGASLPFGITGFVEE